MGQPIWGPIQRHFGPSDVHQVYFLRKSTEFHYMRTDCQIIKTSHVFLTLLLIYHQLPAIAQSIALPLPDHSLISPQSSESEMSNFFLASEAENLNPPSKIAFPDPVPYSVHEPAH